MRTRIAAQVLLLAFCAAASMHGQADASARFSVELKAPADRALVRPASDLTISGTIRSSAPVTPIEYLVNGLAVGTGLPAMDGTYSFTLRDLPAGAYEVTSRVTDETGATTGSAPAIVFVQESATPPEPEEMEGTVGVSIEDHFDKGVARYRYSLMTPTGSSRVARGAPCRIESSR